MGFTRAAIHGVVLILMALPFSGQTTLAEQVAVRHTEGLVRGFLALKELDGKIIAHGELLQRADGPRVTSRLRFQFKNGSIHDETAVFTQQRRFRLLSHRLVQKGPSFKQPLEMTIDAVKGTVVVRYTDDDGERKVETEQMELPSDLANGFISTLLKNVTTERAPKSFSYVAATPKPRLVRLLVTPVGNEPFSTGGGAALKATHYVLKVDIGGIAGVLAPLVGKQPPDVHVWILGGEVPAFIRSDLPLYNGGPIWRIELSSPVWPNQRASRTPD